MNAEREILGGNDPPEVVARAAELPRAGFTRSFRMELGWAIALVLAGVGSRLLFSLFFPTNPVSDFKHLVDFASRFHDSILPGNSWHWQSLNPGVAVILSPFLWIFGGPPEVVARLVTAIFMGLLPLVPYLLLRGVMSLRIRVLAGMLFACWPGFVVFSGVVAQDNWVMLPTVALACLAIRALILKNGGYPIWAAVLLVLAAYIRQEMLLVLLPLGVAAAGLGARPRRLWKNLSIWGAVVVLLLVAIAGQRAQSTGRFSITTEHYAKGLLGAYVPGTGLDYWTDPTPYVVSVDPTLLNDPERFNREAVWLALKELARRPFFHLVRMTAATLNCLSHVDEANLYWSLEGPDTQPPRLRGAAASLGGILHPIAGVLIFCLHAVFLWALVVGLWGRSGAVTAIALVIIFKIVLHAVFAAQPRYFVPVLGLEMLVIALGVAEASKRHSRRDRRNLDLIGAGSLLFIFVLWVTALWARTYFIYRDVDVQRHYLFSLADPAKQGTFQCTIDRGRLAALLPQSAALGFLNRTPIAGETAVANCHMIGLGSPTPHSLQILQPAVVERVSDRYVQRVLLNEREVYRHPLTTQDGGSALVPLSTIGQGEELTFKIELLAEKAGLNDAWLPPAKVTFQLAAPAAR